MVATGYIVDEAVFALYFFAIGCLFFLQLMVERAAKFDQKQLNQKQRLYEWKADRKTNVRTSNLTSGDSRAQRSSIDSPLAKTETAGGSTFSNGRSSIHTRDSPHNSTRGQTPRKNYSSSPPSPGHAAATTPAVPTLAFPSSHHPPPNHNSDDLESSSMSTGATSEEATTPREQKRHAQANAVPHRHSTMRVGPIQWYFHRLGFAICVLQCIRAIDPYGIHDVLPYAAIAFLHHNSIALLYSAGVIAFFAPIQLIRVVAFRKDTPFLRYFGILLSGVAFVLANLVPIIYGAVGLYKYPRFIFNFYVMVSILVACIVFDVFVHKVAVALQELIDFRARSVKQVSSPGSERALFARSPSQQESDSARSNLSTGAVQMTAVAPIASLAPPASGAARAVETVKEASEHSVSIEDNSNAMDMDSGAQSSSARSSFSEEVRIVIPSLSPHVPTINTEARGPEHVANKPSQSLQETVSFSSIDTLASSTSISLNANENQASTATTSPSGSTLQLLPSSSSTHLLTQPPSDAAPAPEPARPRVGSVDTPKTGQHTPSHSGRSLTKPDSGRPTIAAPQQSAQNTISPQTRRDAVAEGYKKVVKNLRRFQVLANILVLGAVAALANKSRKELPTAGDLIEPSSANSYSTGDTFFWSSMVLVFGVAILLWYAYMPMGGLCPGYCTCLRKKSRRSKRHSTSTTPQPGSERRPDSASQSREPSSLLSPPSARRLDDHGLVSMGGPVSVESRRSSVAEETTAQLHASAAQA